MACSCGNAESHVVSRRSTADGKHVLLWNDGSITWALGHAIKGSPFPRTAKQSALALRAGRLVLGDVCLYDAAEVPALIAAARWSAERNSLPGEMRQRYSVLTQPRGPRPVWTVLQCDRDGNPTVRVWKLPRLGWAGLAVWHERGRYDVVRSARRDDTYESTGFHARSLREIVALLPRLRTVAQ